MGAKQRTAAIALGAVPIDWKHPSALHAEGKLLAEASMTSAMYLGLGVNNGFCAACREMLVLNGFVLLPPIGRQTTRKAAFWLAWL